MIEMRKIVSAMALMLLLGVSVLTLISGASSAEPYEMTTSVDAMDVGRVYSAVVAVDDKVYVIGGSITMVSSDPNPTLDDVLIYDIETGEQSMGASMVKGVGLAACAVGDDGLIYVIGGWNTSDGSYYGRVQVYDPVADSWTVTDTLTPESIGYCATTLGMDGMIYMFGGGWAHNATIIYDPSTDAFEYGTSIPYGMHGGAAVALSDTMILVAGGVNRSESLPTTDARLYNPVEDTWTSTGSMNAPRNLLSLAVARTGYVYAIGGTDSLLLASATTVYSSIEYYDVLTGEWSMSSTYLDSARATHGSVLDSYGRVWIVSGYNTALVTNIEMMLTSETAGTGALTIVSPTDGSTVTGIVPVQAELLNTYWSPMMGADLFVDGELYESQSYDDSWVFMWDASGLADGSTHELFVRAYDWDGSMKDASVTVVVSAMSVDEKLDMLETAVSALSDDLAALQATVDLQGADILALQDTVDAIQTALDTLSGDVSDMDAASSARLTALETQLDAVETALAGLQGSVDDVQTSVDDKADNVMFYAVIGLLVVVIVLLIVMMVMGRKAPPPPAP